MGPWGGVVCAECRDAGWGRTLPETQKTPAAVVMSQSPLMLGAVIAPTAAWPPCMLAAVPAQAVFLAPRLKGALLTHPWVMLLGIHAQIL